MTVVSDAGPIIALARIEKLDMLKRFFGKVYIAEKVYIQVVERDGIIENLRKVLEELRRKGVRISDEVVEHALMLAGEKHP